MINVQILIISNTMDFTTDYICLELEKRGVSYLRVNRDCFKDYKIIFSIDIRSMTIEMESVIYQIDENTLKAVYYRAPIYLRDYYQPNISMEEQLYRGQWTAFIRNLAFFENVNWVNNPVSTFKAENKLLQLKYAKEIGFDCPETQVSNTNDIKIKEENYYIVKSLDTALLKENGKEAFVYSNKILGKDIMNADLSISPVIIQNYINPKIDLRVTVIGTQVYVVKIVKDNMGIDGDWRREKENIEFVKCNLPKDIETKCIEIVKRLGLAFGGIDLIESENKFYFIEINPTGEWAWLVESADLKVNIGICDYLVPKAGDI